MKTAVIIIAVIAAGTLIAIVAGAVVCAKRVEALHRAWREKMDEEKEEK